MTDPTALRRQLLLITGAMVAGTVVFAGVVVSLRMGEAPPGPMEGADMIRLGAAAFGVLVLVTAQVVSPLLARTPPGAGPAQAAARIQSGVIVGQGLREAAGLAGGIVGFLTGDLLLMGALVAAGAVTMLLGVPSLDELRRRLRPGGG